MVHAVPRLVQIGEICATSLCLRSGRPQGSEPYPPEKAKGNLGLVRAARCRRPSASPPAADVLTAVAAACGGGARGPSWVKSGGFPRAPAQALRFSCEHAHAMP